MASLPHLVVLHSVFVPLLADHVPGLGDLVRPTYVALTDPPLPSDHLPRLSETGDVVEVSSPGEAFDAAVRLRPNAVLTLSELLLEEAALAAAELGVPGEDPAAATRFRDKWRQRDALEAAGIPVPRRFLIEHPGQVTAAAEVVGYPAVLKPAVGMSSMATSRIRSDADLERAYADATDAYARDARVRGRRPMFVLEQEWIGGGDWHRLPGLGDYVSVESLVHDANVHHICVTDKLPLLPPFREQGDVMPSSLDAERLEAVRRCATDGLEALGARLALTHTEIKLTAQGPRIIELNGRIGGGVYDELAALTDWRPLAQQLRMSLGLAPHLDIRLNGYVSTWWPHAPLRDVVVSDVEGEDAVRGRPEVKRLLMLRGAGTRPDWRSGVTWLADVLARVDSPQAALRLNRELRDTLRFRFADATADR